MEAKTAIKIALSFLLLCTFSVTYCNGKTSSPYYIESHEKNSFVIYKTYIQLTTDKSKWEKIKSHEPGLSRSPGSISFELTTQPNHFLMVRGGVVRIQKITSASSSFTKRSCTFLVHNNKYFTGYQAYESQARPEYFMSRMSNWLIVKKTTSTWSWLKSSMSFKVHDGSSTPKPPMTIRWGGCSESCGGGVQIGEPINCFSGDCSARERDCNLNACPFNSEITLRYRWSECTKPCGRGHKTGTVINCPRGQRCSNRQISCNTSPCTTTRTPTTTTAPLIYSYGPCSASCGSGVQEGWATNCPSRKTCPIKKRPCQARVCPIKEPQGFEKWSQCTKSCGTGHQYKVQRCPENNLTRCPKIFQACGESDCPSKTCKGSSEEKRYKDGSKCCSKNVQPGACGVQTSLIAPRVFGGYAAGINAWPWMVLMEVQFKPGHFYVCGSTIIDRNWILTAAHCVENINESMIKFTAGTNTLQPPASTAQFAYADKIVIHEDYSFPANDIALVKLKNPLRITASVRTVCLPHREQVQVDETCFVAGWGIASKEGVITETGSNRLNEGEVKILPMQACYERYKPTGYHRLLTEDMLCSGTMSGEVDTCLGDSGGPLMCQRCSSCGWYVAGVTSFGSAKCGKGNIPGIYTNVANYQTWIDKYIRTNGYNEGASCR